METTPLQSIIGSYDNLASEYAQEVERNDMKIKELSKFLKNVRQLATMQGDFYSYHQVLISRRRELRKFVASMIKPIKAEERKVLDSYKRGISQSEYTKDIAIRPVNDMERTMYIEDDLKEVIEVRQLVNDHLSYISDSIDNVQRMILGIKYSIEMEKYRETNS